MTHIEYLAERTRLPIQNIDGLQFIEVNDLTVIEAGNKVGVKYKNDVAFVDPTDRVLFRIAQYIRTGLDEIDEQLNNEVPTLKGFETNEAFEIGDLY
ncbi:hypothetical protein [Aeromonas veronii]|uniref:hypothetical protein n=1 Tax=Aeromonas veronii TaxID=654 RepID=UPI003003AA90